MLDNRAWYELADKLTEADFYADKHRLIYRAIGALMSASKPCDFVTISEQLRREGCLEEAGGMTYLSDLAADTPGAANVRAYAEIVRGHSILRSLIAAGQEIANFGFDSANRDHGELVDLAEQVVFRIRERRERSQNGFFEIYPLIGKIQEKLDLQRKNGSTLNGAATGFPKLDELTNGLHAGDLVIVAGRPGMGKCLSEDTQLVADDGSLVTVGSLFHRRDSDVATLRSDWTFARARPSDYIDDGKKPVYEVVTHLGRRIEVTLTHPFLTCDGWKPLAKLGVGDYIAVPRTLPVFGNHSLPEHQARLLGYLVSSGSSLGPWVRFCPPNRNVQQDFIEAVSVFRGCRASLMATGPGSRPPVVNIASQGLSAKGERSPVPCSYIEVVPEPVHEVIGMAPVAANTQEHRIADMSMGLVSTSRLSDLALRTMPAAKPLSKSSGGVEGGAPVQWAQWLQRSGVLGQEEARSIPSVVFRLEKRLLAVFLSCLFSVDGSVFTDANGKSRFRYLAPSEEIARHIQHLLVRFGVVGNLGRCRAAGRDSPVGSWCVDVTERQSLHRLTAQIGIVGCPDELKSLEMPVASSVTVGDMDVDDTLPPVVWRLIERAKGSLHWPTLAFHLGEPLSKFQVHRQINRALLSRIGMLLGNDDLVLLANAEVSWALVTSIAPKGLKQVYDLTMPGTHNFVANDICVHNTSFAMNIAEHVSIEKKLPVAVFSMEMSAEQLALRILSSYGRIDQQRLRSGGLDDEDWARLASTGGLLRDAPLYIDETGALSPLDLRARARRIASRHGLSLIVVDYIQLMQVPSTRENRTNEISEISRSLKALAKELGVPVVALSQLSRGVEQRDNKRPRMSDLRESGGIEQDADVVIFVYRDDYYTKEQSTEPGIAEIIVAKQRNGPTGMVKAAFVGRYTRFDGLTHEYIYE